MQREEEKGEEEWEERGGEKEKNYLRIIGSQGTAAV